jgi:hypothetical protein
MEKRISGNSGNQTENTPKALIQLCKPEVTGSIPVRSISS